MLLKYLGVLALLCAAAVVDAGLSDVDYCSPAYMCSGRSQKHVLACNHTGAFDARCPPNAEMLPMTEEFKKLFLGEHNKYRNEIAKGLTFEPAAAMATLEWDDELAYFAEFNVKQCGIIYEDQKCFTTARYNTLDQNIGWLFNIKSKFNRSNIFNEIKEHIRVYWYEQYHDCTQTEIDSYHPPQLKLILHFGKMVMDRNNRVGCAASLYETEYGINVLFTCNYARRLFCYKPIYRSGAYPGSHCRTGMNPRYPFLCSTKENFNPNDYKV
ncbi:antigen 5 like allergen Cul n 1 [Bactrocera oleae]|uniref:antigen 5 like allergen Cul n 1 n=1 Tax=Bactrocera oleae TaxID=104688 RepID=UPI0006B82337|nr:antigen 5 like allergen Cul n 1 [Bactrocera oleae]